MNQGKLEVVKQEMARVKIDILGISKLKWTEMGEFNLDDHISTTLSVDISVVSMSWLLQIELQ